ncbi:MAG: OmpA family protein [Tenuifilaceae bacterium]
MIKKLLLFSFGIFFVTQLAFGQQKVAGFYVDSMGQVYIQADLPAYFFIAPAENPNEKVLIPSQDPKSNPMYFDGNGIHFIRVLDAESKTPINYKIIADGMAPKVSIKFNKGLLINSGKRFYVEAGSKAMVTAKDNFSGVKSIYGSLNGTSFSPINESIDIGNESDNVLRVYAVDNVGNISDTAQYRIITAVDAIVKINNIYFDTNSSKLRSEGKTELNELVDVLAEYPEIRIELRAHTDSRGDSNYNLILSQNRAEAVANYLVYKGIYSNRLVYKGYGDSSPVNECAKGVDCSEEKLQENRRVEFKILPFK